MNDYASTGLGGALFAVIGIWSIIGIGVYVWYLWSLARLFPYLGLPSGHGWIPIWNQWRLIERGALPGWLVLLGFIPGLGIVVIVVSIIAIHRINQEHGEGAGMTVLGALIPPLWATLLGSRLRDRGYAQQPGQAGSAYGTTQAGGWQPPARRQGFVEYGPDGQVYPLLGAPQAAEQAPAEPAAPAHDNGWALPPVPTMAPEPHAAEPAQPAQPAPAAPVHNNPWSLGNTVDDNFERLAREAPASREGGFGVGTDARPFAWPEPEPQMPPPAPAAPQQVQPAPPAYEPPSAEPAPAPGVPATGAPTPVPAPIVPHAAPAEPFGQPPLNTHVPEAVATPHRDDEVGATVVTGGTSAPIDTDDDDFDRTVVVSRRANWVLELPDGRTLELAGDDIVIGRKPVPVDGSAVLVVPDPTRTLSKSHARLRRDGEAWTVEDLNSTNGVFVIDGENHIEVMPGQVMAAGEHFVIGTLEVRLRTA